MTQKQLSDWCGDVNRCYYYLFDNTGPCPFICEELCIEVENSDIFQDVTKEAHKLHPQLAYEVEHNDCRLYIIHGLGEDIIICYFSD